MLASLALTLLVLVLVLVWRCFNLFFPLFSFSNRNNAQRGLSISGFLLEFRRSILLQHQELGCLPPELRERITSNIKSQFQFITYIKSVCPLILT